MIVAGGLFGGLLVGFGLLFLTIPPNLPAGSHTSDDAQRGSRTDMFAAQTGQTIGTGFTPHNDQVEVAGGSLSFKQALTKLQYGVGKKR